MFLCDLGIAKVKKLNEATVTCTSNNKGPGTLPYMPPEMFKKSRRGPATDIYSLGCLCIELFGHKRIWENLDSAEIMLKVLGAFNIPPEAPSVSHLLPAYAVLCARMCSLDASVRPTSESVLTSVKQIYDSD